MTRESILSKLDHLFRLAEHPNTNPNEAAIAAARAQQIMFEHKISRSEVTVKENDAEDPMVVQNALEGQNARILTWKLDLLNSIAFSNFCRLVYWNARNRTKFSLRRSARMNVYGRKGDVETTLYLYNYLVKEIDRIAYEDIQRVHPESPKRWGASFRLGAAHTIGSRLEQQRKAQEREIQSNEKCTALVKREDNAVKDFVQKIVGKTKNINRETTADSEAYYRGQKAGQDVNLGKNDKQLKSPALQLK
jgi:hypothetical protein